MDRTLSPFLSETRNERLKMMLSPSEAWRREFQGDAAGFRPDAAAEYRRFINADLEEPTLATYGRRRLVQKPP
jgi:hypothetical protein